jgi:hypothetical protein
MIATKERVKRVVPDTAADTAIDWPRVGGSVLAGIVVYSAFAKIYEMTDMAVTYASAGDLMIDFKLALSAKPDFTIPGLVVLAIASSIRR